MITIHNRINSGLKGIIYYKDEAIGECDSVETFLDILCQIKKEQSDDYSMKVEVETSDCSKRTYVYHFTKNGKVMMNKDLLYLYDFSINHDFGQKII